MEIQAAVEPTAPVQVKVKKRKPKLKLKQLKQSKRGPKGPQWTKWPIPYQDSCTMGQLFRMCMKKPGLTIKVIKGYCHKRGANDTRALRYLRSGRSKGWVWDVHETNGKIRVSHPRIGDKTWKKKG